MKREEIIIGKNLHSTAVIAVDVINASELLQCLFKESMDVEFKLIKDILYQNLQNK